MKNLKPSPVVSASVRVTGWPASYVGAFSTSSTRRRALTDG